MVTLKERIQLPGFLTKPVLDWVRRFEAVSDLADEVCIPFV